MPWLGPPAAYRRYIVETLVFSSTALAVAIALTPHAATSILFAFAWGAVLFGGAMTLLLTALFYLRAKRGAGAEPSEPQSDRGRRGIAALALMATALIIAYHGQGSRGVAFLAGYGPGMLVGGEIVRRVWRGRSD